MQKSNILVEKFFFQMIEVDSNREDVKLEVIQNIGQVLGEAADGWLYVGFFNSEWQFTKYRLIPVADLKNALFFDWKERAQSEEKRIKKNLSDSGLLPDVGF